MIPSQPCTTSDTVAREIQHSSPRRIGLIPLRTNCPKCVFSPIPTIATAIKNFPTVPSDFAQPDGKIPLVLMIVVKINPPINQGIALLISNLDASLDLRDT